MSWELSDNCVQNVRSDSKSLDNARLYTNWVALLMSVPLCRQAEIIKFWQNYPREMKSLKSWLTEIRHTEFAKTNEYIINILNATEGSNFEQSLERNIKQWNKTHLFRMMKARKIYNFEQGLKNRE